MYRENLTMNSYLLTSLPPTPPPTAELFTREWSHPILLDPFEFESHSVKLFQTYKDRAIATQQKFMLLNTRLDKYNSTLFGNAVLGVQHTVTWMRDKVGLFHIVKEEGKDRWVSKNVLLPKEDPNSLSHHTRWDGYAWGWEAREDGLVFVMLDGTAVTWLNGISKWCNEVELANEKEKV